MKAIEQRLDEAIHAHVQEHAEDIHLELLQQFAAIGDIEVVQLILKKFPLDREANTRLLSDHEGAVRGKMKKAAVAAVHNGHPQIVREMVEAGLDQEFFDGNGKFYRLSTLLIEAAAMGDLEMVRVLLGCGADVDAVGQEGPSESVFTALTTAVRRGHLEVARILLEAGADPNLERPIFKAVYAMDRDSLRLLIAHGASLEWPCLSEKSDPRVNSALILACRYGTPAMIQDLIDAGADVNARDSDGDTALICAAQFGLQKIAVSLIVKGADVNASNRDGCSALTFAILLGREEISQALLENGADQTQTDTLLKDPHKRAWLTTDLQRECTSWECDRGWLLYWATLLCADCDLKEDCEAKVSRERSTTS